MRSPLALLLALPLLSAHAREVKLINDHWQFHLGSLANIEAVKAPDLDWKTVNLPHDWAIAGPFDPRVSGEQGKLPWKGVGWYRKSLEISAEDLAAGRRAILLFDGVMANPEVYVNGESVGGWEYGYNSFHLDITDHVKPGNNDLVVRASTEKHHSRWYPGAGIYRKVRLILVDPVHIPIWGISITTPKITEDHATVDLAIEVTNETDRSQIASLHTRLVGPNGDTVAEQQSPLEIPTGTFVIHHLSLTVPQPLRWDVDHPHLYTAVTEIHREGLAVDTVEQPFGIRTIEWTADDGFHLNDRRVQLQGVCLHHDNGPLGAALFRESLVRKLTLMKEMGVNAIRTSHNAPSPEMLELCDQMGLLVIDELFDKYGPTASAPISTRNYVENHAEREIRHFIRRDRNHPSIILWSIGNEVSDLLADRTPQAKRLTTQLVDWFHQYDPTRLTNMACHRTGGVDNGSLDALDTTGWNYGQKYLAARRKYPHQPLIYTESASAFSTRGYYAFPHPKNRNDFDKDHQESSYDLTSATWSDIPDVEFMRMERDRYVAGEFVWTGFDYLGEPTPHTQEARSSYFGIVDLVGIPKDRYYLYRSHWNPSEPTVHLLPHWTWPDRVGQEVPVYVYTNGDEAELFLNGKSLGRRKKSSSTATSLSTHKPASASSEEFFQDAEGNVQKENRADKAFDGDTQSRWCAEDATLPQWLQVDLKQSTSIPYVAITWEKAAAGYEYELLGSENGESWKPIARSNRAQNSGHRAVLYPDAKARFLRVNITHVPDRSWASIAEIRVETEIPKEAELLQDPYYQVMDRYRLRWENVRYEPGALGVVAYKDGMEIGREVIRTAGAPAALRLTPEPVHGDELRYILVEAIDADGNLCPQDMRRVTFTVDGPATLAGVGNGDPMGLDPFQDASHPLFYGKAVLIVRRDPDGHGPVTVRATGQGLPPISSPLEFR
ncbi:hypothetical protein HNR46_004007 [Haloferula luteola]|uniref:F5/8 type C domain-containing protein n=1 Tax=Haloferula luteola TaxID=595692 RepID=A0A840V6U5_9BACT|nr:glycoside hydrolase family 2 TIM barrel-domain containing protein [Haloferula luteola]MBB5353745.1 hypothetical protein [Haloferula luteola]